MSTFATLISQPGGKQSFHVDLTGLETVIQIVLRRASIFLGYAVRVSEAPPLATVSLGAAVELSVGVPDPIPPAERAAYQQEFRNWSIGQGLIELDQGYQRFLAGALDTRADIRSLISVGKLSGRHKPHLANTWETHKEFYAEAQPNSDQHEDSRFLRSLGNARNCLAHDAGLVLPRRLFEQGSMPIRWRGQDMYQTQLDGACILLPRDRSFQVETKDIGSTLEVRHVIREMILRHGDRIEFSQTDLSEIIYFYQTLAMQVSSEMHRLTSEAIDAMNAAKVT